MQSERAPNAGCSITERDKGFDAVDKKQDQDLPPPVISGSPEKGLEHKLRRNPEDPDAKADVGSDESMDASDPSAAAQPGTDTEPVPSSQFPE